MKLQNIVKGILSETNVDNDSGPKGFLKKEPKNWLTEKKDDEKDEDVETDEEGEDIEIEDIDIEDIAPEDEDGEEEGLDDEFAEFPEDRDGGLSDDEGSVLDNLEAALNAAKGLGDEKLVTQIGNSITFFTRSHIVQGHQLQENKRWKALAGIITEQVNDTYPGLSRDLINMLEGNVNINTWGQIQDNMAFVIQEWLKEGFDVEDVVLYLQAWAQELGGEVGRDAFN